MWFPSSSSFLLPPSSFVALGLALACVSVACLGHLTSTSFPCLLSSNLSAYKIVHQLLFFGKCSTCFNCSNCFWFVTFNCLGYDLFWPYLLHHPVHLGPLRASPKGHQRSRVKALRGEQLEEDRNGTDGSIDGLLMVLCILYMAHMTYKDKYVNTYINLCVCYVCVYAYLHTFV